EAADLRRPAEAGGDPGGECQDDADEPFAQLLEVLEQGHARQLLRPLRGGVAAARLRTRAHRAQRGTAGVSVALSASGASPAGGAGGSVAGGAAAAGGTAVG